MQPADEVGGDYYNVLKENGMIHIGIGDVTGHGLESGVLMRSANLQFGGHTEGWPSCHAQNSSTVGVFSSQAIIFNTR